MTCPNCQSETNGLKLNNRLYCTECGFDLSVKEDKKKEDVDVIEDIKAPAAIPAEKAPLAPKEPEIEVSETATTEQGQPLVTEPDQKVVSDIDLLESEEKVLELVEEEAEELEEGAKKKAATESTRPDPAKEKAAKKRSETKKEAREEEATLEMPGPVVIPSTKKLPNTQNTIKKHERPRTDLKKEGDFVLIPGEPDPIAEPELKEGKVVAEDVKKEAEKKEEPKKKSTASAREHDKVESVDDAVKEETVEDRKIEIKSEPKEIDDVVEEVRKKAFDSDNEPKPVIDVDLEKEKPTEPEQAEEEPTETVETADVRHDPKTDFLLNFIKEATKTPVQAKGKKSKKKKSKKHKINWKIVLSICIPLFLLLSFVGLVLYVRLYAGRPEVFVNKAEESAKFVHLTPTYIPAGYTASIETSGTDTEINYAYKYLPDEKYTLTVLAKKSDVTNDTIQGEVIKGTGNTYLNVQKDDRSLWHVGKNTLYYVDNGVLYTITGNKNLSFEELDKVALGLK